MRCPRCDSVLDEAAVRCPACGAPLQLVEEPSLPLLDCTLDLDRRRSRTPVPASSPPPSLADEDEGDLGDLSFDPPADDGPWTLTAVAHRPTPEPGLAAFVSAEPAPQALAGAELDAGGPEGDADDDEGPDLELGADPDPLAEPGHDLDQEPDEDLDEPDEPGELEPVSARRGRLLSLASIAVAGAAVLVAVLSSR